MILLLFDALSLAVDGHTQYLTRLYINILYFRIDCYHIKCAEFGTMTEEALLREMKQLSVYGESQIISQLNLRNMCQDHQEDIRHFPTRLF